MSQPRSLLVAFVALLAGCDGAAPAAGPDGAGGDTAADVAGGAPSADPCAAPDAAVVTTPEGTTYCLPPGFELSASDWSWEVPESWDYDIEGFLPSISRNAWGPEELLRLAESVYPPPTTTRGRFGGADGWSHGDLTDGLKCPAIATRGALRHYLETLSELVETRPPLPPEEPYPIRGRVLWKAELSFRPEFQYGNERWQNVFVAKLRLDWSWYCGGLCGHGMEQEQRRLVVLTERGVLAVFDDEVASCWIS